MKESMKKKAPADAKKPSVSLPTGMNRRPWKIVSGGQTGVDRAGLTVAMSYSIETGGWVPKGRLAEDGIVPERFNTLKECPTGGFRERTRMNVIDSDATLILVDTLPLTGGTAYTADYAAKNGRPCKVALLSDADAVIQIRDWMLSLEDSVRPWQTDQIVLNVAGPRESGSPGIFERAKKTLMGVFDFFLNHPGKDPTVIYCDKSVLEEWIKKYHLHNADEWIERLGNLTVDTPISSLPKRPTRNVTQTRKGNNA